MLYPYLGAIFAPHILLSKLRAAGFTPCSTGMLTRLTTLARGITLAVLTNLVTNLPVLAASEEIIESVAKLLEVSNMQDPSEISSAFAVRLVETKLLIAMPDVKQYKPAEPSNSVLFEVTTALDPGATHPLRTDFRFSSSTCISLRALERRFSAKSKQTRVWGTHQRVQFHVGNTLIVKNSKETEFAILASPLRDGDCASQLEIRGKAKQ